MRHGSRKSRGTYPDGLLAIYDNGGRTADRYMVVYAPFTDNDGRRWWPVVNMGSTPYHPQGVCMSDSLPFRPTSGAWGGPGVERWRILEVADLPADCQRVIADDLDQWHGPDAMRRLEQERTVAQ